MSRRYLFRAIPLLLLSAGCAAQRPAPPRATNPLVRAESYELLSLSPRPIASSSPRERFHGWEVLGRTTVDDAALRDALTRSVRAASGEAGGIAIGCFQPRHGIRVTGAGTTTDYVICFRCASVRCYTGAAETRFLISRDPQPLLDEALQRAGVIVADG